jgi:hypothetical protein
MGIMTLGPLLTHTVVRLIAVGCDYRLWKIGGLKPGFVEAGLSGLCPMVHLSRKRGLRSFIAIDMKVNL